MFTRKEIIQLAVRIEENGEQIYRKALKSVSDPRIARVIEQMADDERNHSILFLEKKDRFNTDDESFLERLSRVMLIESIGDQNFSLKSVDFSKIRDVRDVLTISLEFEKDTIMFYEMLQPFAVDPETRETLAQIIREEKNHVEKLTTLIEQEPEEIFADFLQD